MLKKHLDNIILHRLPGWKNLIKSKPQQGCPMQSKLVVKKSYCAYGSSYGVTT